MSGAPYDGSVLVLPQTTLAWPAVAIETVPQAAVEMLIERAHGLDLCLIGCGPRVVMLPQHLRTACKSAGLHIEPMDTGSACRTFNVLTAEGRAVAAALIAVAGK